MPSRGIALCEQNCSAAFGRPGKERAAELEAKVSPWCNYQRSQASALGGSAAGRQPSCRQTRAPRCWGCPLLAVGTSVGCGLWLCARQSCWRRGAGPGVLQVLPAAFPCKPTCSHSLCAVRAGWELRKEAAALFLCFSASSEEPQFIPGGLHKTEGS